MGGSAESDPDRVQNHHRATAPLSLNRRNVTSEYRNIIGVGVTLSVAHERGREHCMQVISRARNSNTKIGFRAI
jgi:hypothetical protein